MHCYMIYHLSHRQMTYLLHFVSTTLSFPLFSYALAAGILAPAGIVLSPAVGAVLMSVSTVIVAINAMTLKMK